LEKLGRSKKIKISIQDFFRSRANGDTIESDWHPGCPRLPSIILLAPLPGIRTSACSIPASLPAHHSQACFGLMGTPTIEYRQFMTEQELMAMLKELPAGTSIPGMVKGKTFLYSGLKRYPSRGKWAHMAGENVVILESMKRKRREMLLFPKPLLFLVNQPAEDFGFGRGPDLHAGGFTPYDGCQYPNMYSYSTYYKCFARYLHTAITQSHATPKA